MQHTQTLHERRLLASALLIAALAVVGHWVYPLTPEAVKALVVSLGLSDHLGGNHFVDTRSWLGLPNTLDVLSNLPFAIFGVWGLLRLGRVRKPSERYISRASFVLVLFFVGLIFTTFGSSLYHLAPSDNTLLWDRAGMAFAFAGVLGIAASERVSARSGIWLGLASLLAGLLALWVWSHTSDVLPWMTYQFGGMGFVLALAVTKVIPKSLGVSLAAIVGYYAAAKVLEATDHAVFEGTGQFVSGHTLKHLVASLAAWPVIRVLNTVTP
jgi:hypothetical protein